MASYVVAYVSDEEPLTYLIGGDELFAPNKQPLFYVYSDGAASLGLPVMRGSITAHMPGVDWKEYDGGEAQEAALLEKFQAVLAADEKRAAK